MVYDQQVIVNGWAKPLKVATLLLREGYGLLSGYSVSLRETCGLLWGNFCPLGGVHFSCIFTYCMDY